MEHLGVAQAGHSAAYSVVPLQKATACAAVWDFCSSAVLEAPTQRLLAEGRLRRGGRAVTQVAAQSAVLRTSDVGKEGGEALAAAPASFQSRTEQLGWEGAGSEQPQEPPNETLPVLAAAREGLTLLFCSSSP